MDVSCACEWIPLLTRYRKAVSYLTRAAPQKRNALTTAVDACFLGILMRALCEKTLYDGTWYSPTRALIQSCSPFFPDQGSLNKSWVIWHPDKQRTLKVGSVVFQPVAGLPQCMHSAPESYQERWKQSGAARPIVVVLSSWLCSLGWVLSNSACVCVCACLLLSTLGC